MLRVEGLTKSFGSRVLLDAVDLHVHPGDRIGLVGRNGEGKTTLLELIAKLEPCDDGRVIPRRGARIGYLRQEIDPQSTRPLIEEVQTVHEPLRVLERAVRDLEHEISALGREGRAVSDALASRYDAAGEAFRMAGGYQAEANLRATLTGLGIASDRWERPLNTFSGGWLMRVELAKLLLSRPEILLLDEPTNHLDIPSIAWFEDVLASYEGAVVVVSHDRTFLDRHVSRIAELDRGKLTSYSGNYSAYLAQKAEREAVALSRRANLEKQIAHAQAFVDRFGAKDSKASQAESRKKKIAKLRAEQDSLALPNEKRKLRFRFRTAPRSGETVLRLERVAKAYDETVVYRALDLEIRRDERIALVGPNGAGKSTLLRIAAGVLAIDAGERELGHNVEPGFYAQHQLDALDPRNTVLAEVESVASLGELPRLRSLLGTFLFSGDDVKKKVSVLSGGEKARLALAKLLLGAANFLILDEPTNHLDLQAREVLAAALTQFTGTMLFISHDRSFINSLATRVLEVRPGADEAQLRSFPGDYDDYARCLAEQSRPDSDRAPTKARKGRRSETPESRQRKARLRDLRARVSEAETAIDACEREVERLGWLSADPALARDGERMRKIEIERRRQSEQLTELFAEWESLSGQIEALQETA